MARVQVYPQQWEDILGFQAIRAMLSSYCLSEEGRKRAQNMGMTDEPGLLEMWLGQTEEFHQILLSGQDFPDRHYYPVGSFIHKASIDGGSLLEEEFIQLRDFLKTIGLIVHWFHEKQEQFPLLYALVKQLTSQDKLIHEIDRRFDDKGQLRPTASPMLYDVLFSIQKEENRARKSIHQIIKKIHLEGWGPEMGISVRNERLVVAVFSEHKKKIPGLVHDMSATGQTFFIEPAEVFEMNNRVRELYLEKSYEVRRILTELTRLVAPHVEVIFSSTQTLGLIDFIQAKGRLALSMKATRPALTTQSRIHWIKARNPILEKHLSSIQRSIVPLTLELNREHRIVVISGPNAGGKSVVLKTLGLLQVMTQCGLMVPVSSGSETTIFRKIFSDIGDQQNMENDLSTYSSHLANMKHFLSYGDSRTLLLMDEFGTGTDPQLGGPMAEAILEKLATRFSLGAVSTHYSNLKRLASQVSGLCNGSMLFDQDALKPLFIFESGRPGSSYTFEIASRSGIDIKVIEKAKIKAGSSHQKMEKLLSELEKEKVHTQQWHADLKSAEEKLKVREHEVREKEKVWEEKKLIMLRQAKEEASLIVKAANVKIENIIREIRESQADPQKTKIWKKDLEAMKKEFAPQTLIPQRPNRIWNTEFQVGNQVMISESGQIGEVTKIVKEGVEVSVGSIRAVWPLEALKLAETEKKPKAIKKMSSGLDLNEKMRHFNGEINVIGKRAEEALSEVFSFLDEALLLGYQNIRIVHGRGAGILKNRIRQELRKLRHIESLEDDDPQFGGDAITIVHLK